MIFLPKRTGSDISLSSVWENGGDGRTEVDGRIRATATGCECRVGKAGRPGDLPDLERMSIATVSKDDSFRFLVEANEASAVLGESSSDGTFPVSRGAGGLGLERGISSIGTGVFVDVLTGADGPDSLAAAAAAPIWDRRPDVMLPSSRPCAAVNLRNETELELVDLFGGLMGVGGAIGGALLTYRTECMMGASWSCLDSKSLTKVLVSVESAGFVGLGPVKSSML